MRAVGKQADILGDDRVIIYFENCPDDAMIRSSQISTVPTYAY